MNALKGLFLSVYLILPLTAACQPTDSLTEVPVPKYVLWRMFHDIDLWKSCDSLVDLQQKAIHRAMEVMGAQDSLLQIRSAQIDNYEKSNEVLRELYTNQVKVSKSIDAERKRWKLTTFIGGALIVLITIL